MSICCGIDLGGTKIEGVLVDSQAPGTPLKRLRADTQREHGAQHVLQQIKRVFDELKSATPETIMRVGLGHPGTVVPSTGLVKNSNTTALNGIPLKSDLERLLGVEIVAANDANCFALAEATLGAARGARNVFGVIMGTGCGGGIVIDGKVISGLQGIAGEWGHNVLHDDGPQCYCGKKGCVETFLSGVATERFYQELTGQARPLAEIASRCANDSAAEKTIARLCNCFGRAIGVIINILDPDVIVLGGGVSNLDRLYTDGLEATRQWVFNDRLETKIIRNSLGDSAGVFGAAMLVA